MKPQNRGRQRGRGHIRAYNINNITPVPTKTTTTTTTTTTTQASPKQETYTARNHNYYNQFNNNHQSTTQSPQQQFNYNSNFKSENSFYQQSSTTVIPFQRQPTEKPYNPYSTVIQQQKPYQNNQHSTTALPQNVQKQTTTLYSSDEPIIEVFKIKTTKTPNYSNKNNFISTTSNYNGFNNNFNNKPTEQPAPSNYINNNNHNNINNNYNKQKTQTPLNSFNNKPTEQSTSSNYINNNNNNNNFNKQTTQIPVNRHSTQTTFKPTSEQPQPQFNFYNRNYDASSQVVNNYNSAQEKSTEINYKQYENKNYNNDYNNNYKQYNQNQNQVQRSTTQTPIDIVPSTYNPNRHSQPSTINSSPRGFSQNPSFIIPNVSSTKKSIDEKYQTVSRTSENYTPSTVKKFSTLVPKESYNPTTFKPGTYKKNYDISTPKFIVPDYTPKQPFHTPTTTLSPSTTTTTNPPKVLVQTQNLNIDEDDGQYHPELYEKDFARNKIKQRPASRQQQYFNNNNNNNKNIQNNNNNNQNNYNNYQTTTVSYQSSEDEFLKTAHSINIAASGNEIRAEKARQASPRPFSKAPTIPPNATTTKKSPTKEKDASYDYAYYDSVNSKDYSEYDLIEDFGKTKRSGKNKN